MSGRAATRPPRRSRVALALGLLAAGCALLAVPAAAQPPADAVDDRPPLPPEPAKRPSVAAKYRIDPDRAIFQGSPDKNGVRVGGIVDDKPLASEKENFDEYTALTEVVLHANQESFTPAGLADHAVRDLTPGDLAHPTLRRHFRLDLVRFEGKVTTARRVRATKALRDAGVKEYVQAWVVPDDESPTDPVCFLFAGWPADLPPVPEIPDGREAGESVTIDRRAAAGGYFFKVMLYPGPDADPAKVGGPGWLKAPLLIGKAPVVPPAPPPPTPVIDRAKLPRVFKLIRDDAPIGKQTGWEELAAWDRLFLHALKFTPQQLEEAARHDRTFADLVLDRRTDYQFELLSFAGKLIRVRETKSTPRLVEAGVPALYECWLVPEGEPRGLPLCVVTTELPPGLVPKMSMYLPATVAGYSFKLMHYESGEQRKDDPAKSQWKKAPLLIGRTVAVQAAADDDGPGTWSQTFLPLVLGGLLLLIAVALAMSWYFRRGDRAARAEADANLRRNPFADGTM